MAARTSGRRRNERLLRTSTFNSQNSVIPNEVRDLQFAGTMQIPHSVRDDSSESLVRSMTAGTFTTD